MHTWSACVIGGGVVGLTTALLAQEKGARVTLIADKFNDETTSDGAAGIFRPSTSFFVISPDITRDLIAFSYRYYENLLNEPGSGVKLISGYHVSNEESNTRNHLIEPVCPVYRPATAEELKRFPGEWKYGAFYTTLLIECRFYLPWAAKKFTSQGGQIIEAKIDKFADVKAHGDFDLIFNCTGFGAKKLCNDDKMVPISGQVFKVDAPWCDIFLYDDGDTYLIPGYLLTVGGSRHFESFRTKPCPHDGAAIWSRAKALQPRLDSAKIVRQWVGVRPYRSGGVRVQAEINDGVRIVHNYGHGGYGVTSAPGTALHAVQLALEFLISNKL